MEEQSGDSTSRLRGNPDTQELKGTWQVARCRGTLHVPSTPGDRGRCPAAEPTAVVKSLSLDELASLKTTNNVNSLLHPTVPHLQASTTPHWNWKEFSQPQLPSTNTNAAVAGSRSRPPQSEALVLGDRELAQLQDITVSYKKGTLDNHLVLKHHLLITCIKHTSAQQRCMTRYNS